ncbi:MAG: hypothetical protein ABI566_10480 [Pseudolysinimonas sp.]
MTNAASTTKKPVAPAAETTTILVPADPAPVAAVNGFSITALVLGITGIALGQGLLSIGAIVFGFVARSKEPQARLMANWGLVLGFVGTFGGLLLTIWGIAAFAPFALWAGALGMYF